MHTIVPRSFKQRLFKLRSVICAVICNSSALNYNETIMEVVRGYFAASVLAGYFPLL